MKHVNTFVCALVQYCTMSLGREGRKRNAGIAPGAFTTTGSSALPLAAVGL